MRASTLRGIWKCAALLVLASACEPAADAAPRADPAAPAVAISRDTAHEPLWSYRLTDGWMSELKGYDRDDPEAEARDYDVEHRAQCKGTAMFRRCPTGDCWSWALDEVKCTGKGDPTRVDWLNATGTQSLCKADEQWILRTPLIGRGECDATPQFDVRGELVALSFICNWKCSSGDPCEGGAEYEFTRNSAPGMTSTSADAGALRTRHGI